MSEEIVVTPEMIEAGRHEFAYQRYSMDDNLTGGIDKGVERIYRAMRALGPPTGAAKEVTSEMIEAARDARLSLWGLPPRIPEFSTEWYTTIYRAMRALEPLPQCGASDIVVSREGGQLRSVCAGEDPAGGGQSADPALPP